MNKKKLNRLIASRKEKEKVLILRIQVGKTQKRHLFMIPLRDNNKKGWWHSKM